MKHMGNVLKKLRQNKGWSVAFLAQNICSIDYVRELEKNDIAPDMFILKKICHRLSITLDELLERCEEKTKETKESAQWFDWMKQYMLLKEYTSLDKTVNKLLALELPLTLEEKQLIAYYQGVCFLYKDEPVEAIIVLERGLTSSARIKNKKISELELLIMNELGFAYYQVGFAEESERLMSECLTSYFAQMPLCDNPFLLRIFYQQAVKEYESRHYSKCAEMICLGLSLCHKKMSLYLLEDFLYLKGMLLQDLNHLDEAIECVDIAEKIQYFEWDRMYKQIAK